MDSKEEVKESFSQRTLAHYNGEVCEEVINKDSHGLYQIYTPHYIDKPLVLPGKPRCPFL